MRAEELTWVGGEHLFALTLPLIDALQQRSDGDGIGLIYQRLTGGSFKASDVVATVALGLEGGGLSRLEANKLVRQLYEDHGLNALVLPAQAVIGFALNGWPSDEEAPEKATGEAPPNP